MSERVLVFSGVFLVCFCGPEAMIPRRVRLRRAGMLLENEKRKKTFEKKNLVRLMFADDIVHGVMTCVSRLRMSSLRCEPFCLFSFFQPGTASTQ